MAEPPVFADAVRRFWNTRQAQSKNQQDRGGQDQGSRGHVTAGKQMDGFVDTLVHLLLQNDIPEGLIHTRTARVAIPGFYRPTKQWDLVVANDGVLYAAIELKSHVGPSFANNANNRAEEAVGTSEDLWTAYRDEKFGTFTPWVGYLFLLEDCAKSRSPVRVKEPHFTIFEEFRGASYMKRYELLCRKLVLERKFTSTCLLVSSRDNANEPQNYFEPAEDLSAERLIASLLRHVTAAR